MFKILAGDSELWSSNKDRVKLGSPTLSLGLNSVGSLSFKIYPDHELYNSLEKLKTIVSVYQDDELLFKGRIYSDKVDMYKIKTVEVEGLLGFLNDTIVRPYSFKGSVSDYVKSLIDQHNAQVNGIKKINLGRVTVTDPNDYIVRGSSDYPTTWKEINDKLIDLLGGYLVLRYESDGMYLDYLADFDDISTQSIAFGVNLLDLSKEVKGDSIATCIIPRGATIESEDPENEKRVDITSVNNGLDYVRDEDAVTKYGTIYQVVTWDNVTEPSNLLTKAKAYLSNQVKLSQTLTLKAVDLHLADKTVESFRLGKHINVISGPHGIIDTILLSAYKLDLSDPANCTIEADASKSSFTDTQIRNQNNVTALVNKVQDNVNKVNQDTLNQIKDLDGKITTSETESKTYTDTQLKSYYTKTETDSQITASESKISSEMSKKFVTQTQIETIVTDEVGNVIADSIKDTTSENSIGSAIEQKADAITSEVSQSYVTVENMTSNINDAKDYTDSAINNFTQTDETYLKIQSDLSKLEQRADGFDFSITKTEGDISGNSDAIESAQNRLNIIENHVIIDKDGNINLVGTGSEFSSQFAKDKLSFMQSGQEVAYLSNSKLYITDAEVLTSLVLGKFAFIPRDNGSLDFKKVG